MATTQTNVSSVFFAPLAFVWKSCCSDLGNERAFWRNPMCSGPPSQGLGTHNIIMHNISHRGRHARELCSPLIKIPAACYLSA